MSAVKEWVWLVRGHEPALLDRSAADLVAEARAERDAELDRRLGFGAPHRAGPGIALLTRLRDAAAHALPDEPVVAAWLFGSHARGRSRSDSDVDVAVLADEDLDAADRLDLALRLPDVLARAAGGPVDVVVLNDAPLPLAGRALKEGVVLYSRDEPARVDYTSLTLRRYLDFEPRLMAMSRAYLAAVAAGTARPL